MNLRTSIAIAFVGFGAATVRAQSVMDLVQRSGGNLRVDVNCADYWATPDKGLTLTVDGVVAPPIGTNGAEAVGYTRHGNPFVTWVPTDVGYAVTPGTHHLQLDAPGCASSSADVEVWPFMPRELTGRLATTESSLLGPAGAPNGPGLMFSAYTVSRPAHPGAYSLFQTTYAYDPTTESGGMLSFSYEHRGFVFANDMRFGDESTTGTAMYTGTIYQGQARGPFALSGSTFTIGNTVRLGARLPLHDVALAAGTGVGFDVRIASESIAGDPIATPTSNGPDGDWYVPLWAAATIKPTCNWGAQVLASYELHPTASAESSVAVAAGLIWQPSASCADAPGLVVR